jgi:HlyD family secretion protein
VVPLDDHYRVDVRFVVLEGANVLKLPGSALFRSGEGWSVFVVEGGRAQRRDVQVGHRTAFETELLSGIGEGEVVIRDLTDRIAEGVRVAVRKP